jgi:hypothetical protein
MGLTQSMEKIGFEDMQSVIKKPELYILINTLTETEQNCLIPNTVNFDQEEIIINSHLKNGNKNVRIIIYGKNCNDDKIIKKYQQLSSFGFYNIFIYTGGMFEWLLLQDIYGSNEFPTTAKQLDILKYKPPQKFNICLLQYS